MIDGDLTILRRPIRPTDDSQSIGVSAATWTPDENSIEMKGTFTGQEPTISRYFLSIQGLIKHMDEIEGLAIHTTLSRRMRTMLYRDNVLAVGLRGLSVSTGDYTERMMRWGVRSARYYSNELNAVWVYLTTLEFWFETETI